MSAFLSVVVLPTAVPAVYFYPVRPSRASICANSSGGLASRTLLRLGCYGSGNWSCQRFSSLALRYFSYPNREVLGMFCESLCKLELPVSVPRAGCISQSQVLESCPNCGLVFHFPPVPFLPTSSLRVHRHTTRTGAFSQIPSTLPGRQQVLIHTPSSSPQTLPPCQATSQGSPPTSPPRQ